MREAAWTSHRIRSVTCTRRPVPPRVAPPAGPIEIAAISREDGFVRIEREGVEDRVP